MIKSAENSRNMKFDQIEAHEHVKNMRIELREISIETLGGVIWPKKFLRS